MGCVCKLTLNYSLCRNTFGEEIYGLSRFGVLSDYFSFFLFVLSRLIMHEVLAQDGNEIVK